MAGRSARVQPWTYQDRTRPDLAVLSEIAHPGLDLVRPRQRALDLSVLAAFLPFCPLSLRMSKDDAPPGLGGAAVGVVGGRGLGGLDLGHLGFAGGERGGGGVVVHGREVRAVREVVLRAEGGSD